MPLNTLEVELHERHFNRIAESVRGSIGINLREGKENLVRSRLMKRLRLLGLSSFDEYIELLGQNNEDEFAAMIDCITTNKTSFFRESEHFAFLKDRILPSLKSPRLTIWCAGCSTGEEPYSVSIALQEAIPDFASWNVRILATDISTRVLAEARQGQYAQAAIADVPPTWLMKHFAAIPGGAGRCFAVTEAVRRPVTFARLNLMDEWLMRGPFDLIFCRNVMIYFEKSTQHLLVRRFAGLLASGGHLFTGHSESLTGINHDLTYVQPAVYRK